MDNQTYDRLCSVLNGMKPINELIKSYTPVDAQVIKSNPLQEENIRRIQEAKYHTSPLEQVAESYRSSITAKTDVIGKPQYGLLQQNVTRLPAYVTQQMAANDDHYQATGTYK